MSVKRPSNVYSEKEKKIFHTHHMNKNLSAVQMKFQVQHGHTLATHQAYKFECACLANKSSWHNLYFICLAPYMRELDRQSINHKLYHIIYERKFCA